MLPAAFSMLSGLVCGSRVLSWEIHTRRKCCNDSMFCQTDLSVFVNVTCGAMLYCNFMQCGVCMVLCCKTVCCCVVLYALGLSLCLAWLCCSTICIGLRVRVLSLHQRSASPCFVLQRHMLRAVMASTRPAVSTCPCGTALPCPAPSVLPCPASPGVALPCLTWGCPALPHLGLPCPDSPGVALPWPPSVLPSPTSSVLLRPASYPSIARDVKQHGCKQILIGCVAML